jgi:capsular polysaccharide transport system permease protein
MRLSPPTRPSEPAATPVSLPRPPRRRAGPFVWYLLLVLLPTVAVGGYYAFYAADIYESESRFLVRGRQASNTSSGALGALLGGAGVRTGSEEARAVVSFLDSFDAVAGLRRSVDIVTYWRRPEADEIAKLRWENPESERLLRYYRRRVTVEFDTETGITRLKVHAFRPRDSQEMNEELLRLSEELVNRFSNRTLEDTLRVARQEVRGAEQRVEAARQAVSDFRERERSLDPAATAAGAVQSITQLEGALRQARTEQQERSAFMRPDNPQMQVLNNRIAALTQQIASERARITRGDQALTQQIADYERLLLEREFADRQLTSAYTSLESTRADAQRQQIFLMRVAEPHLPERALFPRATFNTVTVFLGLTVLFGIGWLLIAGAREHAS